MISRSHQKGDAASTAIYSDCENYRYVLTRIWDVAGRKVLFIMLNPSTADATNDDPTIRRCMGFARDWGYGILEVGNLFAYRAAKPEELADVSDPVGPENDGWLSSLGRYTDLVVYAGGNHGAHQGRAKYVKEYLWVRHVQWHHLGLTRAGQPRHPLYLAKSCPLILATL